MKPGCAWLLVALLGVSRPALSDDVTTTQRIATSGAQNLGEPLPSSVGIPNPVSIGRPSMLSWDVALSGGLAWSKRNKSSLAFGRLRAGAIWIHPPLAVALGPTICAGGLGGTAWGGQLQMVNFAAGLWAAGGVEKFIQQDGAKFHVGAGYSLLGIEWQRTFDRSSNSYGFVLQLHIPVGLVYYLITH